VAVEQGCVPDGGDDGSVGAEAADEGRAAATVAGGAAGSGCGARSAGWVAVPALRGEEDAAAARAPRWARHPVQRVRRAVPERPARTGVPAGEQPQLLPGSALQLPPAGRPAAPPPGGVDRGRQCRRRLTGQVKGFA